MCSICRLYIFTRRWRAKLMRGRREKWGGQRSSVAVGVVGVNGWVDGAEGAAADLFALRVPELGLVADPGAPSQSGGSGSTSGRGKPTTKMEDVASAAAALVLALSEACFGDSALVASRVWAERYRSLAVEVEHCVDRRLRDSAHRLRHCRGEEAERLWAW